MAEDPFIDLDAPFTSDTLLEVRMGKMKAMSGLKVKSGIDKQVLDGPVRINDVGVDGDEHDLIFHGGVDKAIHGYCSSHYATWRKEFPAAADRFQPGGFGENFVTARMNERNVCIGDVVAVGDSGVLLQISLPRQPCFKLNHRFQVKNFAPNTWRTSRTGWYYRVLHGGSVCAGDEIRLVERTHPRWTIERVQEYLHRNKDVAAMNEELAAIEALGAESRDTFKGRVAKQRANERKALVEKIEPKWRDFKVAEKKRQTARTMSFVLEAVKPLAESDEKVGLDPGAHAKIKLGNGLVRAYSIVDGDRDRFQVAVSLDQEKSRGGSKYLHGTVEVGHVVQVGSITNAVPLVDAASHHVFVAGGIGITAFLPVIEAYRSINFSTVLHYAIRSAEDIPFRDRLDGLGDAVVLYDKSKGQRLKVGHIIEAMPWNSQLYFCGPKGLMDEALRECRARGVPETEVHWEAFEADISGDPFDVVVANRGNTSFRVGEDESLLDGLKKTFGDAPSSCEVGNCGTCKIGLLGGRIDHRGTALTEEEKATSLLSCVSRGIGRIVIEI